MFEHKTVLITGGTGSFGRTMARHLLDSGCPEIRIFSRDETKQGEMRDTFGERRLKFYIGDVRDDRSIDRAVAGADLVFHAAALKQVPSCEFFPMQAVLTNIIGSSNVIEAAENHGVERVVCLSTDKAVYPINAMGMSKALMEKVVQASSRDGDGRTVACCVRYGNVMFSRGSVIPLFVEQILAGKPLTVTEPEMTRFMLPLSGSVDLVAFALARGEPGDVFVRKAPACTVGDLVDALLHIFAASNPVETIGMRHGEKLYETLASKEELRRAEDLGDHLRLRIDGRDLNYDKYFVEGDPGEAATEDYTSHNTTRLDVEEVEALLRTLPEIRDALDR